MLKRVEDSSGAHPLEPVGFLTHGKLEVLITAAELFEEVQRRIFGDTTRYRVMKLFLEKGGPTPLSEVARELGLRRSTGWVNVKNGIRYPGALREAVERLTAQKIILERRNGRGLLSYSLNTENFLVRWLAMVRSLIPTPGSTDEIGWDP